MNFKEILESTAEALNLFTHYGEDAYNNLFEFCPDKPQKKFIFTFEGKTNFTLESGLPQSETYTGRFFICSDSNLDEYFDKDKEERTDKGKYELYLKPNHDIMIAFRTALLCLRDYKITSWTYKEVINVFDMGADGILTNFIIEFTP